MRVREILEQEQKQRFHNETEMNDQLFDRIATECSLIVSAMKTTNKLFYRGTGAKDDAREGVPRPDRRPLHSDKQISNLFNDVLAKLGIKATRANSIFGTTTYKEALYYAKLQGGDVYILFPTDTFDYTYSPYNDVILDPEFYLNVIKDSELLTWAEEVLAKYGSSPQSPKVEKVLKDLKQLVDLGFGSLRRNAIQLVVHHNFPAPPISVDKVDMKKFLEVVQPKTSDIETALTNGYEVYVHGSYYAINSKHTDLVMKKIFGKK